MAEPTTRFRLIPNNTAVASINTPAERLAVIAGESVLSTGAGNEADFGLVDISGGAANSGVLTVLWDVTVDGGNTLAETFKYWLSSNGFDKAGSVLKVQPLSGGDQGAPANTENYVVNAVVGSYTWATMSEAEPGAINVWPTDEGTSIVLDAAPPCGDDAIMWAMYVVIANLETTGTYKGVDAGYQLQFSYKYSYS
ncbi:MAG: hypothetical protein IMF11_09045 [Proteobacteria bacterium]|nr:hypothetical protein [Pseudomonadota bacterium]